MKCFDIQYDDPICLIRWKLIIFRVTFFICPKYREKKVNSDLNCSMIWDGRKNHFLSVQTPLCLQYLIDLQQVIWWVELIIVTRMKCFIQLTVFIQFICFIGLMKKFSKLILFFHPFNLCFICLTRLCFMSLN